MPSMENNLKQKMLEQIASGLKRQTLRVPSVWAEECVGATFRYHPWEREMLDSRAPVNIGQKSAQMGYSTTVINRTFYTIDIERLNCLYLLPTKTPDATDFSVTKFDPALESSPYLSQLFSSVKNIGVKRAGNSTLWIRGMNSTSALKGIDPAFIVFDELDEMPPAKIPLAEFRQSGQKTSNKRIWKISTPTVPDFGINLEMKNSTQEHYFFKCPCCSRRTELIFPDCFVQCGDSLLDPDLAKSHIICKECKHILPHGDDGIEKAQWLNDGSPKWESTVENPNWDIRGFYINQLYSTRVSPKEIAEWVIRGQIDPAAAQELHNSLLGLPFVPEGARLTPEIINACMGNYSQFAVPPANARIITMGVDVGKRLHYEVDLWSFPEYGNDLNLMAQCKVLAAGAVTSFDELDALMQTFRPNMTVIDSEPESRASFEFATRYWGYVKLHKFTRGHLDRGINMTKADQSHYITTDRTSWLDCSVGRFKTGRITIPKDLDLEYTKHLTNLVKRYRQDSNNNHVADYVSVGADHAAFARCYAEIALPLAASVQSGQDIAKFL